MTDALALLGLYALPTYWLGLYGYSRGADFRDWAAWVNLALWPVSLPLWWLSRAAGKRGTRGAGPGAVRLD